LGGRPGNGKRALRLAEARHAEGKEVRLRVREEKAAPGTLCAMNVRDRKRRGSHDDVRIIYAPPGRSSLQVCFARLSGVCFCSANHTALGGVTKKPSTPSCSVHRSPLPLALFSSIGTSESRSSAAIPKLYVSEHQRVPIALHDCLCALSRGHDTARPREDSPSAQGHRIPVESHSRRRHQWQGVYLRLC
jgi:hypothetical protein